MSVDALKRRVEKLDSLLDVATAMAAERDLNRLLQLILKEVREAVEADRCSLFILDQERGELWSKIAQGLEIREIRVPVGVGVAGYVAETGEVLNIDDVYEDERFDRSWDVKTGYRTRAMLCVPMKNRDGRTTGVIQAINKVRMVKGKPQHDEAFSREDQELLIAIGTQAASAIENALLNDDIDHLFEGFVKASVTAIESRDPTTSGHSERVAVLTLGIADHLPRLPEYRHFKFSTAEMKEIRYAALLHDFGKVGVREHILVKAEKLSPIELKLVQQRFALIKRTMQLDAMRQKFELARATGESGVRDALAEIDRRLFRVEQETDDFLRFINECNRPTVLAEGSFERLHDIQCRSFHDVDGTPVSFLSDQEVEFLSVRRGSLTLGERNEIESHVVHTYKFLNEIPWTRELRQVPVIAYAHHEKLDGHGYPRRLLAEGIPVQSRMMTIADIYDALTASDRPYKKAVPHEKALDILHDEARQQKVDANLLRVFVEARVHEALSQVKPVEVRTRLDNLTQVHVPEAQVPEMTLKASKKKTKASKIEATKAKPATKTQRKRSIVRTS